MGERDQTVFITGASSGIGLATAQYFVEQGWNVVATMRDPAGRSTPLHDDGRADLVHLDVTDQASIDTAVERAVAEHGAIDVLVNNAGYALTGPFECTTDEQVRRQFDTNVFGLMHLVRAFLPVFRKQGAGLLINVASMGGRMGYPLYSVYNGTKWAVEGFSEALRYELPQGTHVKIIEPGAIATDFYGRSADPVEIGDLDGAYDEVVERAERQARNSGSSGIAPRVVARAIFRAATDGSRRLRYPVGPDAWQVAFFRRLLPERVFFAILRRVALG